MSTHDELWRRAASEGPILGLTDAERAKLHGFMAPAVDERFRAELTDAERGRIERGLITLATPERPARIQLPGHIAQALVMEGGPIRLQLPGRKWTATLWVDDVMLTRAMAPEGLVWVDLVGAIPGDDEELGP